MAGVEKSKNVEVVFSFRRMMGFSGMGEWKSIKGHWRA